MADIHSSPYPWCFGHLANTVERYIDEIPTPGTRDHIRGTLDVCYRRIVDWIGGYDLSNPSSVRQAAEYVTAVQQEVARAEQIEPAAPAAAGDEAAAGDD